MTSRCFYNVHLKTADSDDVLPLSILSSLSGGNTEAQRTQRENSPLQLCALCVSSSSSVICAIAV